MDLRQLRYFVVLAETLHFARAAARLGVSQPPVSQQLRALELELGTTLLKRTSRRVELTATGKLFLTEAKRTLSQADHARDVAWRAEHGEIGEINIGLTPSIPLKAIFHDVIAAYQADWPHVRLTLHQMSTQQQIEALREERLQIGFLRTPGASPAFAAPFSASVLDREELVAVTRDDHILAKARRGSRISLASLAHDPYVMFVPEIGGITYDQITEHCRAAGFEPRIAHEARDVVTLLGLVAAGLGITLIASSFQPILLKGLVTRNLLQPAPSVVTWLAHSRNDASPLTKAFVATVMALKRTAPRAS